MKTQALAASLFGVAYAANDGSQYPLSYGTAWAGPVRYADNFNLSGNSTGFTMAEATLVMPHLEIPKKPREEVNQYTASYWIGLDGVLSSDVIRGLWQAGVIMSLWPNGTTQYTGFHEWIPHDPIHISTSQLAISEGDHIQVVLKTNNNGYRGSTTLTNLNTSKTYTHSQDAATSRRGPAFPAQGATAEWIIEAGTYLNGPRDKGKCSLPGDGNEDQGQITAVLWNDTKTIYTRSSTKGDRVSIEYVEEHFSPK
ncbi:hypothetical protein FZEAL_10952 [Fusarium zealandicum]|uniref:Concanavalin A-like lectin/glucanase n=1 Tax=Fusarium zealandicum TaxID=1053134 RepID=A0A8H4TSF8_9HYPO|nr:hypothetical protein FZEAL_10952 [Fusarium zealandicum]